jgi:hypothetical protein
MMMSAAVESDDDEPQQNISNLEICELSEITALYCI